jgi:hypothetical protein
VAFCCAGLLLRREGLEEILKVLPEVRQRELRQCLAEISDWSVEELGKQLKTLRHGDMVEAIRRCGPAGDLHLESLPVPLQRILYARAWESNGRENH